MALIDAETCTRRIIGSGIEVHRTPYDAALSREFQDANPPYSRRQRLPAMYSGEPLPRALDMIVDDDAYIETEAVQAPLLVHEAQLHGCLKISGVQVGLLINFNEDRLIDGMRRRFH
jgi:GxxExxY protein